MRLGTGMGFARGLDLTGDEKYRLLSQAGFECVDTMIDGSWRSPEWQTPDEELRRQMEESREAARRNDIEIYQFHAPFDCVWSGDPAVMEAVRKVQIQAIKATSWLGARYMVMHPLTFGYRLNDEQLRMAKEKNTEYFGGLRPYLQKYDVQVAIENMFVYDHNGRPRKTNCSTAQQLKEYVDALGRDSFGVCMDSGHAALVLQDPAEMICELGSDYLLVTHMHDNTCINDDHMLPGFGTLDWVSIGRALRDIGYEGVFNYEADRLFSKLGVFRKDLSLDFLRLYAALGKSIINAK